MFNTFMELLKKEEIYNQLIFWEKYTESHSLQDSAIEPQVLYLGFLTC